MPQFGSNPRLWAKLLGVLVAIVVAIASLTLIAVTQEPKHADSSPGPASASIVPQIADAKSEAEIIFRGKSFAILKRMITMPFSGEVEKILVKEGQSINSDDTLVEYNLDRQSMIKVHNILYPEMVLTLQKNVYDRQIAIQRLQEVSIPIKKLELDKAEKDLEDLKELQAKEMATREAVAAKERHIKTIKKEILDIEELIKQHQADLKNTMENLRFYEAKQKRDLELLEWQTHRSYSDSKIPLEKAYLKAPIAGQVIWISPELQVKSEQQAGFHAITLAPMNPIVVRCKVHELDLVKLKIGDPGTVVFDAIPEKKYPCRISRIPWVSRNPSLEVPADYELECLLENPDGRIKDGLTCNVKISVTQ